LKAALVLSGQPRCLDECFDSLKHFIIDPLQTDIFFHFWNTSFLPFTDNVTKVLYGMETIPQWKAFDGDYAAKYMALLKPKRFIVQPQVALNFDYYAKSCTHANSKMQAKAYIHVLSMFYSIGMAHQCMMEWMEKTNTNYDLIIRCRTDAKFWKTPDLDGLESDNILIPENDCYGGLNDQFAITNNWKIMHAYATCLDNIQTLFDAGTNFHPETILRDHLKSHNIPVKFIPQSYGLIR